MSHLSREAAEKCINYIMILANHQNFPSTEIFFYLEDQMEILKNIVIVKAIQSTKQIPKDFKELMTERERVIMQNTANLIVKNIESLREKL
jgi:hypothetical protein